MSLSVPDTKCAAHTTARRWHRQEPHKGHASARYPSSPASPALIALSIPHRWPVPRRWRTMPHRTRGI